MEHRNFTNAQTLEVDVVESSAGVNVCMMQRAGSMSFQFSATSEQARAIADDLLSQADKADRICAAKNPVVRLERDGVRIVAHFEDGSQMAWCSCDTERGAKARLTHHAKRLGFVVAGNVATANAGEAA